MKRANKKQLGMGCIAVFVLISVVLLLAFRWQRERRLLIPYDESPGAIARVFVISMMRNRDDVAKSLSTEDLWSAIDDWVATRIAANCSFPLDGDWGMFGGGHPGKSDNEYLYFFQVDLPCQGSRPDNSRGYSLRIDDILLRRIESGWRVTQWGNVCETWHLDPESSC